MAHKPSPQPLFRAPAMSSDRVEQLVERINAGKYAVGELANLYDNALDRDLTAVKEAVVARMREQFPAAARRKFGAVPKAPRKASQKASEKAAENT